MMTTRHLISLLILCGFFMCVNLAHSLPPPCTQEELLNSSSFAVEGKVLKIECGQSMNSRQCSPSSEYKGNYKPELISKCNAVVKVTKNIKGSFNTGDLVVIPFIKLVQQCRGGTHILPGIPKKNFPPGGMIRYYSSGTCRYWNLENLH